MQIIHSVDEMHRISGKLRSEGSTIGLVPTMGSLHQGHLSLVDLVKDRADIIILSIFVNPTQFAPGEDFEKYPRNLDHDLKLCRERKVDIVFVPESKNIYLEGSSTSVIEERFSSEFCGLSRPAHFQGVTTVCAKLFNICCPNIVVLGQKDAQQILVLKQMIKDLNFPIEVITGDIFREDDGLAMSSRNVYLTREQRKDALFLFQSLQEGKNLVENGIFEIERIESEMLEFIKKGKLINLEFLKIVNRQTLEQQKIAVPNQSLILLAARVGDVRLIDNQVL
jgi:pantoate--beta-alanine ligase